MLTGGERYSPLTAINRTNAGRLRVLCSFDTREQSSIGSGLLAVDGVLVVTSNDDTYALDPDTCSGALLRSPPSFDVDAAAGACEGPASRRRAPVTIGPVPVLATSTPVLCND